MQRPLRSVPRAWSGAPKMNVSPGRPRPAQRGEETTMEIVIAAVVVALGLAAGLVGAASLLARRAPALAGPRRTGKAPAAVAAEPAGGGGTAEAGLEQRRGEMVRFDERLLAKEASL